MSSEQINKGEEEKKSYTQYCSGDPRLMGFSIGLVGRGHVVRYIE